MYNPSPFPNHAQSALSSAQDAVFEVNTKLGVPRSWLTRIVAIALGCASVVGADADGSKQGLTQPLPPTQRLFIENTNLTVKAFFAAYMSESIGERRYAEMYLLGTLDATEGKSWCDYYAFKTTTLAEEVFSGLSALDASKQSERAAHAIEDILHNKFPCRGK